MLFLYRKREAADCGKKHRASKEPGAAVRKPLPALCRFRV